MNVPKRMFLGIDISGIQSTKAVKQGAQTREKGWYYPTGTQPNALGVYHFKTQYQQTSSPHWSLYISLKLSCENLLKDQRIFPMVSISWILKTICFDYVWILLGENWCWSLLGLKRLCDYISPVAPVMVMQDPLTPSLTNWHFPPVSLKRMALQRCIHPWCFADFHGQLEKPLKLYNVYPTQRSVFNTIATTRGFWNFPNFLWPTQLTIP